MIAEISPFELNRWENEDARHFYFLDTSEYRKIRDSRKHCFVVGHRGTGKTSLLKALNWQERTSSAQLANALPTEPFSDGVVGCYFGLQYLHIDNLDGWVSAESDSVKHDVLSAYLRGLWLEEAGVAVSSLRTNSHISSLDQEIQLLEPVRDEWNMWAQSVSFADSPSGFDYLSIKRLRETAARITSELYSRASDLRSLPADAIRDLALSRFPELINRTFSALAHLLPERKEGDQPWLFYMCLDEGEYLSENGRRTIRTLVRECRSPLLMTVASLDDLGVETLNPRVRLTVNDRLLLDLRKRTPKEFGDLVNGVMNERFKTFGVLPPFKVEDMLSSFDLNELLLQAKTERPATRRQILEWRERWGDPNRGAWSPIREYLSGSGLAETGDAFDHRAAESAGYRKKHVAAYLRILAVLGESQPIYAGAPIVLKMMESSLRDLFMFLDQCFEQSVPPGRGRSMLQRLETLVSRAHVPIRLQNDALGFVARQKMNNLDEKVVTLTSLSRRLVEFFSRLSHRLDMEVSNAPLGSIERTMFVIRLPSPNSSLTDRREESARMRAVLEAIHNCTREGYLVGGADTSVQGQLHVRVNRTLAKLHGFSFRAPQYESRVDWSYLDQIALNPETSIERLSSKAADLVLNSGSRPSKGPNETSLSTYITLPLFEVGDE